MIQDIFLHIADDDRIILVQVKGDIDMDALEKIDLDKTI